MGPFLPFLLLSLLPSSSPSDLTDFIYKGCANQRFQDPSSTQTLSSLSTSLIAQSSTANFFRTTDQSSSITALYQCRGDLSTADCSACVRRLPDSIARLCGGDTVAARVQLAGCYMRYEVAGFPQVSATELLFKRCGSGLAEGAGFDERLAAAMGQVEKGVGNGKGFYAGGYESLFVLGQCEGDLRSGECVDCVKTAAESAQSACRSSTSGHIFLQQCYVSYNYYPNGVPGSEGGAGGGAVETGATETGGVGGGGRKINTQKTVAIVFGGLAGLFLGVAFLLVLKSAFKKKKEKYSYGGY